MKPLICRLWHGWNLLGRIPPRFTRTADGRQVHQCPQCEATWLVLPSVADVPDDFRPEIAVLEARAQAALAAVKAGARAARQQRKAAKLAQLAGVPSIGARKRA